MAINAPHSTRASVVCDVVAHESAGSARSAEKKDATRRLQVAKACERIFNGVRIGYSGVCGVCITDVNPRAGLLHPHKATICLHEPVICIPMGASDSKLSFKQGIFRLSEPEQIPADDAYWTGVCLCSVPPWSRCANCSASSGSCPSPPRMSSRSSRRRTSVARATTT